MPEPLPPDAWDDLDRPPLRADALQRALAGDPIWRDVRVVPDTGSTNADLTVLADDGEPEGLVLVAEHQSAGRGRLDRTWVAPPRSALTMSVLLRPGPGVRPARWAWAPLLAGVAVAAALTRTAGVDVGLKWPNDVQAGGRKLGGLLAERAGAAIVIGIGLNVSLRPEELPGPEATSLALEGAAVTDRDTLLRAVLRELGTAYVAWRDAGGDPVRGLRDAYRERCTTLGRDVRVVLPGGSVLEGLALDVDVDGRLVVRDAGGTARPVGAGDVVHVR